MAENDWNAGNGDWTTAADWSLTHVPTSSEDAYIQSAADVTSSSDETVRSVGVSTNGMLDITGGTLTATKGTGPNAINGDLDIEDAAALVVGNGALNITGTINLFSLSDPTNLYVVTSTLFEGGGTIHLNPLPTIHFEGAVPENDIFGETTSAQAENVDDLIFGQGSIGGLQFTNDNGGTIRANRGSQTFPLQIWGSAIGGSFSNTGEVLAADGAALEFGVVGWNSTINNQGLIQALGKTLTTTIEIAGDVTFKGNGIDIGGLISLAGDDPSLDTIVSDGAPATLENNGDTIVGAGTIGDSDLTLKNDQSSEILADQIGGTLTIDTGGNAIVNAGLMEADNNGELDISCSLNNTGSLAVTDGNITIAAGATLTNAGGIVAGQGGGVTLDGEVVNQSSGVILADGGIVDVDGEVTGNAAIDIGLNGGVGLQPNAAITGNVTFIATGGSLFIEAATSSIAGEIVGAGGNEIAVDYVSFSSALQAVWQQTGADGVLSLIQNGSTLAQLDLAGQFASSDFTLSRNRTGTLVSVSNPAPPSGASADMILRNSNTGYFEIYDIGNNAIVAAYGLGQVGLEWNVVDLGGFDGSETTDMIMRNKSTGAFELYDISNNNITNAVSLGQVGLEWRVSGFGDLSDNPGETDMVMRDTSSGDLEVYDISNNVIASSHSLGQVGLEWVVSGFGDFSGLPGETDMLMRNTSNGNFEIYDISANQLTSSMSMGQVGMEWIVVGTGDFSGNANESDMLMRNTSTGAFELYDISNNQITNAVSLGQVGLEWQVAGFGPIDGAGTSDMLMRDSNNGDFEVYDITNNAITTAASMGQVGTEWAVAGIAADPPGASTDQLAQVMASFGTSAVANGAPAPVLGTAEQSQTLMTTPLA